MTDEQINERIALLQGWKRSPISGAWCHPDNWSMALNGAYSVWVGRDKLPNYAADLNACHEFEKTLDTYELAEYWHRLLRAHEHIPVCAGCSDARQRCEAFLRVHNQWEEEA